MIVTVDTDDLVTAAQIAVRLEVSRSTPGVWEKRYPDYPKPVIATDKVKLWSWTAVQTWNQETS